MNAMEQASERRLAVSIAEARHGVAFEELTARIAARLATEPAIRHPARGRLWAAALVFLGVGIAVAVGHLARARSDAFAAASTQDPQPAQPHKVTNADCKATTVTIEYADTKVHEALASIARQAGVPVVISSEVRGNVTSSVKDAPWREALEQVAAAAGGKVHEHDNVILVAAGRPTTKPGARLSLHSARIPFEVLAMTTALVANASIVIAPGVGGDLGVDLDRIPWRSALDTAAAAIGAEVVGTGEVLVIRKRTDVKRSRMSVNFDGNSAEEVFGTFAKIARLNLVIDARVRGQVTVKTNGKEVLQDAMMQAIAAAVGAEINGIGPSNLLNIVPRPDDVATPLALRGDTVSLRQLADLSKERAKCEVAVTDADGSKLWVFAPTVSAGDLWRAVALATGRKLITDPKQWRLE